MILGGSSEGRETAEMRSLSNARIIIEIIRLDMYVVHGGANGK